MLTADEVREAASSLHRLLLAVEAGELVAGPGLVRRIEGATAALEALVPAKSVR